MAHRLQILLMLSFAWIGWATANGWLDGTQRAWAQAPDRSSRPEGETREERRARLRRYFGDRGGDRSRGDWRGSRARGDGERRGEDRSSSTSSTSTSSSRDSQSTGTGISGGSTSTASSASSSAGAGLDLRKWATELVRKNDKNGDMILQPDEQGSLGSSAAAEDLNHDGMITIDELVMYRSGAANAATVNSGSSSTSSDSGRNGGREHFSRYGFGRRENDTGGDHGSNADSAAMANRVLTGSTGKEGDKRHSYRFTAASDRKPGLPSELRSRDANGDGQVSMSEFSRYWSDSTVAEFRRWDLNNDGIITPKEAAKRK